MGTQSGGDPKLTRAAFYLLEADDAKSAAAISEGSSAFFVQFNPTDLKLTEGGKWNVDMKNLDVNAEYQSKDPSKLDMTLIFDTTDSTDSVMETWVKHLQRMVSPTETTDPVDDKPTKRPPFVRFKWGKQGISFAGVVDKLTTTLLMFSADGTPKRAQVALSIQEIDIHYITTGGKAANDFIIKGMFDKVTVVTAQAGDTSQSIADKTGGDAKAIAKANGKDDVTEEFKAGEKVVVTDDETAEEIAEQAKKEVPSNTTETVTEEVFTEVEVEVVTTEAVVSSFDDMGEDELTASDIVMTSAVSAAVGALAGAVVARSYSKAEAPSGGPGEGAIKRDKAEGPAAGEEGEVGEAEYSDHSREAREKAAGPEGGPGEGAIKRERAEGPEGGSGEGAIKRERAEGPEGGSGTGATEREKAEGPEGGSGTGATERKKADGPGGGSGGKSGGDSGGSGGDRILSSGAIKVAIGYLGSCTTMIIVAMIII